MNYFQILLADQVVILTSQFEASDDPLEKITTTEAIRVLVDYYHTSDYYYTTKAKVEEISQYVSTLCSFLEVLFDVGMRSLLTCFNATEREYS